MQPSQYQQPQRSAGSFFFGRPEEMQQVSTLGANQQPILQQLLAALQGQGAGGAYGDAADYYRSLLDPNSPIAQQMFAPEMQKFNQETIPGLSEQFAGLGSGSLSSSGFRNSAVQAGGDLSERLAAMRAGLAQQGAAGLAGLGSQGLQQYNENIYRPETHGLVGNLATGVGQGIGQGAAAWMGGR